MLIAQLSDIHIGADGTGMRGLATEARFTAVIETVNALKPAPELVVLTGDVTDDSDPRGYARLDACLKKLHIPWWVLPGNHDNPDDLMAMVKGTDHPELHPDFFAFARDMGELVIVCLDTFDYKSAYGYLGDGQLDWLDGVLAGTGKPVLVFMHHPPIKSGMAYFDKQIPDNLARVVGKYDHVERIACGHLHRAMFRRWQKTVVSVCPSTAVQVNPDFSGNEKLSISDEPPAFQLHRYLSDQGLVTHTIGVPSAIL